MARFSIMNNGMPSVIDWAVGQKNRIEAKKQQDKAEWNEMMRQGMLAGWLLGNGGDDAKEPAEPNVSEEDTAFNRMKAGYDRIDKSPVDDLRTNALGTDLDLYLLLKGKKGIRTNEKEELKKALEKKKPIQTDFNFFPMGVDNA